MTLKCVAVVVAAVSSTLCLTANVVVGTMDGPRVPILVDLLAITTAASATVLAVVAHLCDHLNARITALTEFLIARLDELDSHTGDRNAGFVEGYLLSQNSDAAVVPIAPRLHGRRALIGGDD